MQSRYEALSKGLDALLLEADTKFAFESKHQKRCAVGGVPWGRFHGIIGQRLA
jgi:hypothetical protein